MFRSPGSADTTGTKRKDRGRLSAKKNKSQDHAITENATVRNTKQLSESNLENEGKFAAVKRSNLVVACSDFKEKSVRLQEDSLIIEHEKKYIEEEMVAIHLTKLSEDVIPPCRRLVDFILHDADGAVQPFEMCEMSDIFMTALIVPLEGDLEKQIEKGVPCKCFGRIESWALSGYDEGVPVVWVSTEIADYECVKPASSYKKTYDHFHEKAHICVEVYQKLAKSVGGNPSLSLEELLAGVVLPRSTKSYSKRDFVISIGEFIYNQLSGLKQTSNDDECLDTLPALVALRDECKNKAEFKKFPSYGMSRSMNIEGENAEVTEDKDEKLALLLQEEWKMTKKMNRRTLKSQKNIYIKISEAEIANDYPLPAYYKPTVQEMDENLFQSESIFCPPLAKRVLRNWSLYNSDSRLISLELLPMKPCAETDTVFGSGCMIEDAGTEVYGEAAGSGQSSSVTSDSSDIDAVPIYLSAIKEWMIEFRSEMIFTSIRTDLCWYVLGTPSTQYAPWYDPVLKTARLAISIITLLKEPTQAAKLSFADVVKKVSEFAKHNPAYISSNLVLVERYVVVHGQIILQQFAEYPDKTIAKCAFVTGLSEKLNERRHTKLIMKKVGAQRGENLNPSAAMGSMLLKKKAMRATTTKMINRIWEDYYSTNFPEDSKDGDAFESKELEDEMEENEEVEEELEENEEVELEEELEENEEEVEEELEENEEEDVEEENATVHEVPKRRASARSHKSKFAHKKIRWIGDSTGETDSGESLYVFAVVHGVPVSIGGAVNLVSEELKDVPTMYLVEYMLEKHDGTRMVHGRIMQRGSQTILGNAAQERELFLTNECMDFDLADVKQSVSVEIRVLPWGHKYRKKSFGDDITDRTKADERKKNGLPKEFYCKSLYWPEGGAFFSLPYNEMGLGTGICNSCQQRETQRDEFRISSKTTFIYKKTEYNVHDFVFVRPQFFTEVKDRDKFKAGRNLGQKAYVVCKLLSIVAFAGSNQPTPESTKVKVRRFYRPEDVSAAKAYSSDVREVYYSGELLHVPVEMIEGRCEVRNKNGIPHLDLPVIVDHIFFCEYSYDPKTGALKQLPANLKHRILTQNIDNTSGKNKGKEIYNGKQGDVHQMKDKPQENRLSTLDIFAGCGGLSEGLKQAGISTTKWAIEYEEPAGEAFKKNHPDTLMFIDNCNVILRAIMEKCGDTDDCISTPEATELAANLDKEKLSNLPIPGEVDFINGGPPCQGFSGMNRFNHITWSKVQYEMILAFLSFAEYFRPRFFLLENVRNFVSVNKGQTFRLTLASLLEMGYQVRFGILEAGAYGVSQSRKRAFIWAASPGEPLPEWPEPIHVFACPQMKISLPGNSHYLAVHSTAGGAPVRSITVKDVIGDLPSFGNGATNHSISYGTQPVSWFQKLIRGHTMSLNDHISKELNELNLIRCQRIPKRPGADWQDLPDEKVKLSNGQLVDLIPWFLPITAKRHNKWKDLFGRMDWEGNFPTSVSDPQSMGKVGMCFHPNQDRMLSIRECARSQGFSDRYCFSGNIQSKYRQIGNAVPPPLAYALGRKLKEALDAKKWDRCIEEETQVSIGEESQGST